MPTAFASGSVTPTVGTEKFIGPGASVTADTSPSGGWAAPGVGSFVFKIDLVNMVAGDFVEFRVYQMLAASGTRRVVYQWTAEGAQAADDMIEVGPVLGSVLTDVNAMAWSIKQTGGTARAFVYVIEKYAT